MRALDIKLFRDLKRVWALALAVSLVIAGSVATLLMSVGSYRSLDETRTAYYERYRLAVNCENALVWIELGIY